MFDALPWLVTMAVLIGCSAFFSVSEAALFSLRPRERRALSLGNRSQQVAASLLEDPERLLTAVLFWNLVINISYFAIAAIICLPMEQHGQAGKKTAWLFTFVAVMTIILLSEMVPKSLGVVSAARLARLVGLPLSGAIWVLDPVMPILQLANLLSRRLLWPRFQPERYLEIADLERAIQLSKSDAQLVEQEKSVLENIVDLSEMRVDESMRPRGQFRSFSPPVNLNDMEGEMTPSGYLLVTEPNSDVVTAAIHLTNLSEVPAEHLEHLAEPVIYLPWFDTVSDAFQQMTTRDRDVAAIVNELGEIIGILTFEDILETIFSKDPTRSARLFKRQAIREIGPNRWQVTGITSLRRLGRFFDESLPECKSVTVMGVSQEVLEHLPKDGDEFSWGPFRFEVIESPQRGPLTVEIQRLDN